MSTLKNYIIGSALLGILALWGASLLYTHHKAYASGAASVQTKLDALTAQLAAATAKATQAARAQEQKDADAFAKADQVHQQEMKDAQQKADITIADLTAGSLRLRDYWAACKRSASVSTSAAVTGERDAAASVRTTDSERALQYASASRLVKLGADADAQVRELQSILAAERAAVQAGH